MKERISLLAIIVGIFVFLIIFQNYFNTFWATIFLMASMVIYLSFAQLAYTHKARRYRNRNLDNPNYKPFVSVLIPAHNEEAVIEKTIDNVMAMDYEEFEVILIDDRSTDNTAEIIKKIEGKHENVKILIREKDAFPGKSAVLNDAFKMAKGDAILVLDADAKVDPDFLTKLVPHLEGRDIGAVQARKVVINGDDNLLTMCQYNEMILDTHFQLGRDSVKGAVELRGNGELIKRTALEDVGGWNNYTITDDLDISTKLHINGWDICFCPEVCVYEEGVTRFIPLMKQRRRWFEGSVRRYLENFRNVLTSEKMSLRVSFDMLAYITELVLPVWLIIEPIVQFYRFTKGYNNCIWVSMTLSVAMMVFFAISLIYSLRRYKDITFWQSVWQSMLTGIYMIVVWFPTAFYIVFKIIFKKKSMEWGNTQHGFTKGQDKVQSEN